MFRAIEHIAVVARDTEALAYWYRDTLGFQIMIAGRGPQAGWFVRLPEGGPAIEILYVADPPTGGASGDMVASSPHIAMTVDNFAAAYDALTAKGVPFTGRIIGNPGERQLGFFTDPEGNLLQLVYRPTPLGG